VPGKLPVRSEDQDFLANFSAVYHHNGKQTVDIRGDRATGVSYCSSGSPLSLALFS
jgi:hypothetical protein